MPIVVTCPGCPAKLSAPDDAAGKQIRCPKCGTIAPVPALIPAEEMPIVEAAVVSQKPRKPIQAEIDDEEEEVERPRKKKKKRYLDDDDYEHDHPRRKRKSRGGGAGVVIALIVVGGLLLLAVGGGAVYYLSGKKALFAKKAPVPPGWKQYSFPDEGFKVYTPQEPRRTGVNLVRVGRGGRFDDEFRDMESYSQFVCVDIAGPVRMDIAVVRFRSRPPAMTLSRVRDAFSSQYPDGQTRSIRWLGADAEEWWTPSGVMRVACTDRLIIFAAIAGPNGTRASPAEEDGFFDNFELTK